MQQDTRRRTLLGLFALTLLALAAAAAAAGPGHGLFGWRGHGHRGHEWNEAHIGRGVRYVLDEADASDEQVEAVTAIVSAAATDLRALHAAQRGHREVWRDALVAADRATLEAQRAEALVAFEDASERVVSALADAAEVLTPEQRQRLAEAHAAHHSHD